MTDVSSSTVSGVLVVDKPSGPTSHDVVARVRRALGTRRIGHTGTLDPLATGVLPLVIGQATRLASLYSGAAKAYQAGVRLGATTDTYDAAGRTGPPPAPPADVDQAAIEAALDAFRGPGLQSPPAYSAKKINGVAAYTLARRNEPVQPRAVAVTAIRLELVSYEAGLARIDVECSAGYYVRSLAHDLGQRLGCGGYLETLRRVRSAAFGLDAAVALETIEALGAGAADRLVPLERLLPDLPGVVLNDRGARRASHGNDVAPEDVAGAALVIGETPASARWRLVDEAGALLGIAERGPSGLLHPVIVLV